MSTALEPRVPAEVRAALDADPDPHAGLTLLLLTVSEGWPHQAMLSVGEVVALDESRLALALWPQSSAARALATDGRATLTLVLPPTSFALRVDAVAAGEIETPLAGHRARFTATVVAAASDTAPYATLTSGVRFSLNDPGAVVARWREVREALRT